MSYVAWERLKSPRDQTLPFFTRIISFGTGITRIDTLQNFGLLCKAYRITNNDAVNVVKYRIVSPSAEQITIQPLSEASDETWTSYLEIDTAGSGGQIELELVEQRYAYGT